MPPAPVRLRVPATSANLGPGFDVFGLALDLTNEFEIEFEHGRPSQTILPGGRVLTGPANLVAVAYEKALPDKIRARAPGLIVRVRSPVPISRGLGSSASALVAGVGAAGVLLREENQPGLTIDQEIQILNDLEGHPDNVCPARLGGWVFSYFKHDHVHCIRREVPDHLGLAVVVPDYEISTAQSRQTLPGSVSLRDTIENMTGVLLWFEFLTTGDPEALREAIRRDRLHEPYRAPAIRGYSTLVERLHETGAYGATISGSGPSILVYFRRGDDSRILPLLTRMVRDLMSPGTLVLGTAPSYAGLVEERLDAPS